MVVGEAATRRRDVEISIRRVRWVAVVFALLQFTVYTPPTGLDLPFPRYPVAAFVVVVLILTNLAATWALRRGDDALLRRLGTASTIIDTSLTVLMVVLFGFDETTRIWPLLTFPIVEGAMRSGIRGAMATWAYGAGLFVVDQIIRLPDRAEPASWVGGMTFAAGILLFVAMGTGLLSTRLAEATARAEERADRLRRVAELGRRMTSHRRATEVFTELVSTALELTGFDLGAFYEREPGQGWRRHASEGLPQSRTAEPEPSLAFDELAGKVGEPMRVPIKGLIAERARLVAPEAETLVVVPVFVGGDLHGLLLLGASRGRPEIDDGLLDLLRILAADAAVAIRNADLAEAELNTIDRLRKLDDAKDDFVAVLTHELRTPMTSIVGYAELLRRQSDKLSETQKAAFTLNIEEGVRRLSDLIGDILEATQAEHTELAINAETFDLVPLVREVAERDVGASPHHRLVFEAGDGGVRTIADPDRVRQIAHNLLSNAIKYAPEGGPVTVRVGRAGEHDVYFSVQDEGLGIPEATRDLLFGKFNRLHGAMQIKGTGLGLYLSRTLVEAMNGTIDVDSEEGVGSTFTVRLPPADAAAATPPHEQRAAT